MAASLEWIGPGDSGAPRALDRVAQRVMVVSNRLPVTVSLLAGVVRLTPSAGGVATGLRRIRSRRWIGWSGISAEVSPSAQRDIDARLNDIGTCGVPLGDADIAGYYTRVASGVLWPLLHDRHPETAVESADWETYCAVNARFADAVLREWQPDDLIWIHDFHLMLLPRLLRERRPEARIAFFLHSPFPRHSTLAMIPWSAQLLHGILGADAIGFQTQADLRRFAGASRALTGCPSEWTGGSGLVVQHDRAVRLHVTPMSIDVAAFASRADDPETRRQVRVLRAGGGPLFVGIDRLDPTKGIPHRLEAFGRLLESYPELRGRARLVQLAVPSREAVPAYRTLGLHVETMVAGLNARFGTPQWKPVEYTYGSVDERGLAALYRAADVMLVTPLRDGMNLVAKEFVASRVDESGVLVLSRHAGAANELRDAVLVDPEDLEGLTRGYVAALRMGSAERRLRMRLMRARVAAHDVHRWAAQCLHAADAAGRPAGPA
jgi:trehalose 6-phosphate synthase/phosphatase